METISIISRSDDLGSSISANIAIEQVVGAGFIKNVSVMACGPAIEDAARRLAHRTDICFGMHTVLNAEWDRVKWCPVSRQAPDCGLTDENGFFLPHPALFRETRPSVEAIMTEVRAQYDRLTELGFSIRYIDSHMFSEIYAEGMDAAMEAFAREKGLLDHMYYYNFPPIPVDYSRGPEAFRDVPGGQYLLISHPSLDSEEMRMTGNQKVSGRKVAADRARETAFFSNPDYTRAMQDAGIRTLRYDEAAFDQRLTPAQLDHMLHG